MNDREYIRQIVREVIAELNRNGLLITQDAHAYEKASEALKQYYQNKTPVAGLEKALSAIEDDPYFDIIPLYYARGYTNEKIAELLNVETSTVTRNKKRLCLALYKFL